MTTAVIERPVGQLLCVKGEHGRQCPNRPIVRYMVGPTCSAHLVPGAVVLEWLVVPDEQLLTVAAVADTAALHAAVALPDPARPGASVHADAGVGEATVARLVAYRSGSLRARVLHHLVVVGPQGTTAIEAWTWYRRTYSSATERYSIAPRLSELVADGWAVKTGRLRNVRGEGCAPEEIYVLSPRGRRAKGVTW